MQVGRLSYAVFALFGQFPERIGWLESGGV